MTPEKGIAMVYQLNDQQNIEPVAGACGVTPSLNPELLAKEDEHTRLWHQSIIRDTFY